MSRPSSATRFAIFIFTTMAITTALSLTFLPMAYADDGRHPLCDSIPDLGGSCGTSPTTTTTTPVRDRALEYPAALNDALRQLRDLPAPDARIWPAADANQIVQLESFLAISNAGWQPRTVTGRAGAPPQTTVTLTAVPQDSRWTVTSDAEGATTFGCDGQGSVWTLNATDPDCGYTWERTSDHLGAVSVSAEIEFEVTGSTNAPVTVPIMTRWSEPSDPLALTVNEVQTFGTTDYASGRGGSASVSGNEYEPAPHPGAFPDAGAPNNDRDALNDDDIPVRTQTCRAWLQIGGDVIAGLDVGAGYQFIVQEFADGRRILIVAEDTGAAGGVGGAAGARAYVGDYSVGALAKAEAKAWAVLSHGDVYELEPGQSVNNLLYKLAARKAAAKTIDPTGIGGFIGNRVLPESVRPGPHPDSEYTEIQTFGAAGATAQAGIGVLVATASIDGEAGVTERLHTFDGGFSRTTTYAGSFQAGATVFDSESGTAGVATEVEGSISVETIYNSDGEAVEVIYTRTYSSDFDAGVLNGEDEDSRSVTTQQWSFDLSDPAAAAAIAEIDADYPALPVGSAIPHDTAPFGHLFGAGNDAFTSTTGPVTQQINANVIPFGIEAGLGINAEISGEVGCVELS